MHSFIELVMSLWQGLLLLLNTLIELKIFIDLAFDVLFAEMSVRHLRAKGTYRQAADRPICERIFFGQHIIARSRYFFINLIIFFQIFLLV